MEQEQAPLKRYRDQNRKFLKQIRTRKLQKLRKRKLEGSSSVEPPQRKLEGSSSVEPPQRKLEGSSSVEPPQQNLDTPVCSALCYEMDPVEEAKYRQQVKESRGFDVDDFYLPYGGIGPVRLNYSHVIMGKVAVHCYNYDKGKKLVFNSVIKANVQVVSLYDYYITLEASDPENNDAIVIIQTRLCVASPEEDEDLRLITESCSIKGSGEHKYESWWDPKSVGVFYIGPMPNWIDDAALTVAGSQFYEVKKSDREENDWLYLYMEVAAFAKWRSNMVDQMPLQLKRVLVQTEKEDDFEWKLKSSNAIFFITFKVRGGEEYRGIVRQTRDGRPQHLCLEVVCQKSPSAVNL